MKKLQINGHTIAELPNVVADALMGLAKESGEGRFDTLDGQSDEETLSVDALHNEALSQRTTPMRVKLTLLFTAPVKEDSWKRFPTS